MTKHEELVEEIYQGLSAVDWGFQRSDAEEIIALVLSAFHDVGLDEELGVVALFDFNRDKWEGFEHWVAQALHDDADIFIALRKEGTGKEDPAGGKEEKKEPTLLDGHSLGRGKWRHK